MQNEQLNLDFITDDKLAGFRLHRFELLNWGTFDKHILLNIFLNLAMIWDN